jgi:hypothetical protein
MDINIGDKVRFLDDVGEGTVSKIVNKNIVNVLTSDGFEVPSHVEKLVVVEKAGKGTSENKIEDGGIADISYNYIEREDYDYPEETEIPGRDVPGFFLALVPQQIQNLPDSKMDAFLINDCNYFSGYVIAVESSGKTSYMLHGVIEPNTKIRLKTFLIPELTTVEYLSFSFILFKKGEYEPVRPFDNRIRIPHNKFFKLGCFEENDFFEEPALLINLCGNIEESVSILSEGEIYAVNKEKSEGENDEKLKNEKFKARPEPITWEIDLHINQLLVDCRDMSNHEILTYQINHFHKKINEAINEKNITKIIFIHGIGNGTLKAEIRKQFIENYPKFRFQDASFKEYGFGAIMVILK